MWDKTRFDRFYDWKGEKLGHWGGRPGIRLHYHDWPVGQYQRGIYAPMLKQTLGLKRGDSIALVGAAFNWTGEGLAQFGIDVVGTELSEYIDAEKNNTEEEELRACCAEAGVDPDRDGIIWDADHPLSELRAEPERLPAINNWMTSPHEAESRAKWESVHGPLANTTPLELSKNWKLNPLEIWLRGGLANPHKRGFGKILPEAMENRGSRNTVYGQSRGNFRYVVSEEVLNSISDDEALTLCARMTDMANERGGECVHMLSPSQWYFDIKKAEQDGIEIDAAQQDESYWVRIKRQIRNADLNWKTYTEWRTFLDVNGFAAHKIICTVRTHWTPFDETPRDRYEVI